MLTHKNTSALFTPHTIAVVGASATPGKIGNIVVKNLLSAGFSGHILPINPKEGSILSLPTFSNIADIPAQHRPLDLAVICLPAANVLAAIHQLGEQHTRAAIIISAGFKETGGPGAALELEIKHAAEHYGMAVLGPNSFGLANTASGMNATFAKDSPLPGNIGFFSQSGAFCAAMFDWAKDENIGFSSFVSLGNKMALDESDVLAHMTEDPATKVIVGYLESIESGTRFLHNAQKATRKNPVILLKAGRTPAGARAASSHTGALIGEDMAFEAAFRQTGVIRAHSMEGLFTMAQGFACQPLPKGPGIAVVTNAGGPGIIATDACTAAGLTLARFAPSTIERLKGMLPAYASVFNPVDVVGDGTAKNLADALAVVLQDPNVHMALVLAAPTARIPVEDVAACVSEAIKGCEKPIFACLMGGNSAEPGKRLFAANNIPCFAFPEPAIDVMGAMYRHSQWRETPPPVEVNYRRDLSRARKEVDAARDQPGLEVVEFQALGILSAYEMPMLESKLARTSDEACHIAKQLGLPVALKIASPQISHKTDVGGVVLHLDSLEKVRAAFIDITNRATRMRPEAYIAGCLVQAMAPAGAREVIIGFKRDRLFGPMVMFGLGGIHVETFKDISSRLAPLSLEDVHDMVREIKAFPILAGMRGQKPVKFTAIEDILLIMSKLALDFPEIEEAECNPVLADENGAYVADIRLVLARKQPLA
ncbi:acetate--CoA ligase family protein [Desulfovibrio cuneatus]|uniref:acetate--CoA ligase family protein n=1 Tax=Desulfovibrio cuneatus TaxID=159728 RepID=UPI0003F5F37C|nr:acetate--CoA ligase [Desulfovibrio cuneatus]